MIFLHGRHSACYAPVAWQTSNSQWPCPEGQQPIDSHKGYDGPAEVSPLPKTWLRTVRVPTGSLKGVDLRNVREARIAGAGDSGGVYLADLAFTTMDDGRARLSALPQVSVESLTVPEGDEAGTATRPSRCPGPPTRP